MVNGQKISSESLAALIIDALIDANIVSKDKLELAIEVATEEINSRKAMQDY